MTNESILKNGSVEIQILSAFASMSEPNVVASKEINVENKLLFEHEFIYNFYW